MNEEIARALYEVWRADSHPTHPSWEVALPRDRDAWMLVTQAAVNALAKTAIPMRLTCPECGVLHVDEGEFETKPHHTHACQHCGNVWRPSVLCTVGVRFLPGFRDEERVFAVKIPRSRCKSCGDTLMFSARNRGDELCGPCHRTIAPSETPAQVAWRGESALTRQCPTCEAEPGVPCSSLRGKVTVGDFGPEFHEERCR